MYLNKSEYVLFLVLHSNLCKLLLFLTNIIIEYIFHLEIYIHICL